MCVDLVSVLDKQTIRVICCDLLHRAGGNYNSLPSEKTNVRSNLVWSDILANEIIRTRLNVWQFLRSLQKSYNPHCICMCWLHVVMPLPALILHA